MAIIVQYPPDLELFSSYKLRFHDTLALSQSVYSGAMSEELDFGGQWLTASVTTVRLNAREANRVNGLVERGRRRNHLLEFPVARTMLMNAVSPPPVFTSVGLTLAGSNLITLAGVMPDQYVTEGFFVSNALGHLLYVTDPVIFSGNQGLFSFFPRVSIDIAAGTQFTVVRPVGRWKPMSNEREFEVSAPNATVLTLELRLVQP